MALHTVAPSAVKNNNNNNGSSSSPKPAASHFCGSPVSLTLCPMSGQRVVCKEKQHTRLYEHERASFSGVLPLKKPTGMRGMLHEKRKGRRGGEGEKTGEDDEKERKAEKEEEEEDEEEESGESMPMMKIETGRNMSHRGKDLLSLLG
ncbi:hypothetical protein EYF80_028164 [Liparis tanakae]|uniref:Uncharacterized protein n=1 Tax=Liparis tanakae TaxID=230148 RepID=A0A4Z2H784_9TELE|nr:hypothetical protein EYF80_028164 [Liparis tanakae]